MSIVGNKLVNASFKDKLYGIGTDLDHNVW